MGRHTVLQSAQATKSLVHHVHVSLNYFEDRLHNFKRWSGQFWRLDLISGQPEGKHNQLKLFPSYWKKPMQWGNCLSRQKLHKTLFGKNCNEVWTVEQKHSEYLERQISFRSRRCERPCTSILLQRSSGPLSSGRHWAECWRQLVHEKIVEIVEMHVKRSTFSSVTRNGKNDIHADTLPDCANLSFALKAQGNLQICACKM